MIGTLNRHLESLESFALGGEWSCQPAQHRLDRSETSHEIEYSTDAGWNEFEFQRILSELSSQTDAEPQGRRVTAKGGIEQFEYQMFKWISGRASIPYLSWLEFQDHSLRSLIKLGELCRERGETFQSPPSVICITSAGVITVMLTACLKLDPRQSFSTLMKIYNSSITQIEWSALPSLDEFEGRCDSNSPEMSDRLDGFVGSLRSFNVSPQLKASERTFY
jgi:broad specificity phosphatase PhoE